MKKQNSKTVNSQIVFNLLASLLSTGINFFTIPLFTKMLGASEFGKYSIFISWSSIILPIISIETHSCIKTGRIDYKNNYKSFIKSIFTLGCISSLLWFVLTLLFIDKLVELLDFPKLIIIFMLMYSFFMYSIDFVKEMKIYEKKAEVNFAISSFIIIISSILSFLFIKRRVFSAPYIDRIIGLIIPYSIVGIMCSLFLLFKNNKRINYNYWSYSIAYGVPIVFHLLSHDVLNQSNKILLQYLGYAGVTVGIYAFFQTFSSVMSTILYALNNSWCPYYYDDMSKGNMTSINNRVNNYIEFFTVLTIGFILLSREVCYVFSNDEYMSGINILPFFVVNIYFIFIYQFAVNYEYYNKKTKYISFGTIVSGLMNIILNLLLIPEYGMYGASISSLLSYLLLIIIHYYMANRIENMVFQVSLKRFVIPFICIVMSIALFYLLDDYWIMRWIIGTILGLVEVIRIIERKSIF